MVDGVEGGGKVEEDEDGEEARVGGEEEFIGDFKEGGFSAVMCAGTRMKLLNYSQGGL